MVGTDAAELVAGWKRRLVAPADTPEHVVRDTPRHLIEQQHRRRTTFAGYAEAEVADAEARLGLRFLVVRAYLSEMAESPGDLFRGSELAGVADFESHQGSAFVYLPADGGFDGPPMVWTECRRPTPRAVFGT